jgi:hypothetical protein
LRSRAFADRRAVLICIFAGVGSHWATLTAGHDGFAGIASAIRASAGTESAPSGYMSREGDRGGRGRVSRVIVSS